MKKLPKKLIKAVKKLTNEGSSPKQIAFELNTTADQVSYIKYYYKMKNKHAPKPVCVAPVEIIKPKRTWVQFLMGWFK